MNSTPTQNLSALVLSVALAKVDGDSSAILAWLMLRDGLPYRLLPQRLAMTSRQVRRLVERLRAAGLAEKEAGQVWRTGNRVEVIPLDVAAQDVDAARQPADPRQTDILDHLAHDDDDVVEREEASPPDDDAYEGERIRKALARKQKKGQ